MGVSYIANEVRGLSKGEAGTEERSLWVERRMKSKKWLKGCRMIDGEMQATSQE